MNRDVASAVSRKLEKQLVFDSFESRRTRERFIQPNGLLSKGIEFRRLECRTKCPLETTDCDYHFNAQPIVVVVIPARMPFVAVDDHLDTLVLCPTDREACAHFVLANEEEFLWRAADTKTLLNGTAAPRRMGF